jgi:formate-dependent nitrite reductase membrane component NrfD
MSNKAKKSIDFEIWGYAAGIFLFVAFIVVSSLPPEGSVQTLTFQQAPHKWIVWWLMAGLIVSVVISAVLSRFRSSRR